MPFLTRPFCQLFNAIVVSGILFSCISNAAHADLTPDVETFTQRVSPLLHKYCVRCHGAETMEAEIRFDTIDPDIVEGSHFDKWEDAREAFNTGEMPPEDEPQPTDTERDIITNWLDAEFKKAKQHGNPNRQGGVRRLTRYELQYALEDLLNVSVKNEINALPEEGTSVETGLKNNSRLLVISSPHLESYLNVVLSVINKMKEVAVFEPYRERLDIPNLDVDPPESKTRDGRRRKPPLANVERDGQDVVLNLKGYIDLPIPSISRALFRTTLRGKAEGSGAVEVAIGFKHSDVDPREKTQSLGLINFAASEDIQTWKLDSYPRILPSEMTRALDRPFFIRITNRSKHKILLRAFEYEGNINTELISTLLPSDIADADVDQHLRQSIADFTEKAFRRAPTNSELQKYYGAYQEYARNQKPVLAILDTFKEILCSPHFFYLGLPSDLPEDTARNYHLAERLAFFLACSVPDQQLLKIAAEGDLTKPDVLADQVERLLSDESSKRWVEQFTDQWLQTSKLLNVAVDRKYYPRFKDPLKDLMRQETIEAMNDVLRNGAPALELLSADHVFVNQTLASFYQLKGVRGDEFRKVSTTEKDNRGGLLTQGTFLVGNSDGMNSHAILRGVWLAEIILNDPPPAPPMNVPPLDESIPGFDKMTLNEKLFAHRNNAACRNCHQKIDPWGIPFENFDASGAWREKVLVISKATNEAKNAGDGKKRKKTVFEKSYSPIESVSTLTDGTKIDGMSDLKQYLITHRKRQFAHGLTERILAYALSRDIDYYDEDLVNQLCDHLEKKNYSIPALIQEIVKTEQFLRGY